MSTDAHHPSAPRSAFTAFLRAELTGGLLLIAATVIALVWANVAVDSYDEFWSTRLALGPDWLHLDLTLAHWATDGLLTIFFLVAGIEVKRELVAGELADLRRALLPVAAAIGGMLAPPLVTLAISGGEAARDGIWAIPIATDIAFALGILALVSSRIPSSVRILLLSLAVLDDIVAIALIAILFTAELAVGWIAVAVAGCIAWTLLTRRAPRRSARTSIHAAWLLAITIVGTATWIAMHASGVHATVAGVALGLLAPTSTGDSIQRVLHPLSASVCVPIFALAAAGIPLAAATNIGGEQLAVAVVLGLVIGKPLGITVGAWVAVRSGRASLPAAVRWGHVLALGMLGGIGYTVSLLMVQLTGSSDDLGATLAAGVLLASAVSALLAIGLLRWIGRRGASVTGA